MDRVRVDKENADGNVFQPFTPAKQSYYPPPTPNTSRKTTADGEIEEEDDDVKDIALEVPAEAWRVALDAARDEKKPANTGNALDELPLHKLLEQGQEAYKIGDLFLARELWERALPQMDADDEETQRCAQRLAKCVRQTNKVERLEDGYVRVKETGDVALDPFGASTLFLNSDVYNKLYAHQKVGVKWMWGLHTADDGGGVLGDDMGLGKTIQVGAFIGSLMFSDAIKSALIVVPKALLDQWRLELKQWLPDFVEVLTYHGTAREKALKQAKSIASDESGNACGVVMLTTYGTVLTRISALQSLTWDYAVLDEGHKIRTHTSKQARAIHELQCRHKLLLTGTPIMNNLRNLWALFDWVCDGALLGPLRTFIDDFERAILAGSDRQASATEKAAALKQAHSLRQKIAPHFLRREKASVKASAEKGGDARGLLSVRKADVVLWTRLSAWQRRLYQSFLSSEQVASVLNKTRSPLAAITVLKKIATHPALLKREVHEALQSGLRLGDDALDAEDTDEDESSSSTPVEEEEEGEAQALAHSSKLAVLLALLKALRRDGHKTLLFSMSAKFLDRVAELLRAHPECTWTRLDGSVSDLRERARIVAEFSASGVESQFVMLCTTQACGLGLNLTVADRVIIADPAWNALDEQAVDRVYRIGQTRDVLVYRLITCGTVEEHIYRKQVFKLALTHTMLQKQKQSAIHVDEGSQEQDAALPSMPRYFSKDELCALFTLDDGGQSSRTQQRMAALAALSTVSDDERGALSAEHRAWLSSLAMVSGLSEHHRLFTERSDDEQAAFAEAMAQWQRDDEQRNKANAANRKKQRTRGHNSEEESDTVMDAEAEEDFGAEDEEHSDHELALLEDDELLVDDHVDEKRGAIRIDLDSDADSEHEPDDVRHVGEPVCKEIKSEADDRASSSEEEEDERSTRLKYFAEHGLEIELDSFGINGASQSSATLLKPISEIKGPSMCQSDSDSDSEIVLATADHNSNSDDDLDLELDIAIATPPRVRAGKVPVLRASPSARSKEVLETALSTRKRLRRKQVVAQAPATIDLELSDDECDEQRAKRLVLDLTEADSDHEDHRSSQSGSSAHHQYPDTEDEDSDRGTHAEHEDVCFIDDDDSDEELATELRLDDDSDSPSVASPAPTPSKTPSRTRLAASSVTPPAVKALSSTGLQAPSSTQRRLFVKKREAYTAALFTHFNERVFDCRLPSDLRLQWSSRLRTTSGRAPLTRCQGVYAAHVELSSKVLDTYEKLFQTLCHELCHVAAWLLDHEHAPPHGGSWLKWMRHAKQRDPRVEISARHSYEITHKLTYQCQNPDCAVSFGRDSRVPKERLERLRCTRCLIGHFALATKPGKKARAPNAFATFVQGRLASVKAAHPHLSHAEVMRILSSEYAAQKGV